MKVHELVFRCAVARESGDPMKAMRELLDGLRNDVAAIESAVEYVPGTGGNANRCFTAHPISRC